MGQRIVVGPPSPSAGVGIPVRGSEAFTADLRDGVLCVRWDQDMTVTDEDASSLVHRANLLCPGVCPPMLVELNGMVSLSRCALATFATELNIAAMAIVGPSAVDEILAAFFVRVHNPPYPTHFFTSPQEAHTWLTGHPHAG